MHLKTEKRNTKLRWTIIERIEALKAEGEPVDKGLFEKIGQKLSPPLKGTTVSDIYYDARSREFRLPPGIF
jgi:hypothetical protein